MTDTPTTTPSHIAAGKPAGSTDLIVERRHRLSTQLAPPKGGVLVDFGCGNGAQTILFADQFDTIIGVDIEGSTLEELESLAAAHASRGPVAAVTFDGRELPLANDSVDYIVSFEVLEHVHDERKALSEIARVLKPGATLVMSVPNRWWIFETHGAALPLLPWNRVPFFSWLPKPIHDRWAHARIYSRREIVRKINDAGLEVAISTYITAPMDVVKSESIQSFLRKTVFRGDRTPVPFLSTAVLVVAKKR